MIYALFLIIIALILLCFFPVWKSRKPSLPVLRYGRTDIPGKKPLLTAKTLEKHFRYLRQKGFTSVLPAELKIKNNRLQAHVKNPVMLVFGGGYQTIYIHVFPLLQKWQLKAVVGLPVSLIGTYDAWHNPEASPWQNLLTEEQISVMQKSGLISFAPHGLEYANPNALSAPEFLAQAAEARHRMQTLYKLPAETFVFTRTPQDGALAAQLLQTGYAFTLSPQPGNNPLPADTNRPLRTFKMRKRTFLPRLYLRMTR